MSKLSTHTDIIELWPSLEAFSKDVDYSYWVISKWYQRNNIPPRYWVAVVEAAHRNDFPVTFKLLAEMVADKKNPLAIAG